ncbi:dihydroneopterin aldolase, partial [Pseudomonas aeruginosa]
MSSILTGRRTLVVASLGAGSEVDRVFIEGLE